MINTNLPPILHRFRDMAVDRSKIAIFYYPSCLTPPPEGFPWDDLRMAKVLNAVEILPKISTVSVGCTGVSDDRRQTDGRAIAHSERERVFTFAKILLLISTLSCGRAPWSPGAPGPPADSLSPILASLKAAGSSGFRILRRESPDMVPHGTTIRRTSGMPHHVSGSTS